MLERRFFGLKTELRLDSQGDEIALTGYAARFKTISENLGGFRETLCPGCFQRSLQSDRDVKALFNHQPEAILGRKKNGTLNVGEDRNGLKFRVVLPHTQTALDVYQLVKRGDADSCSFAFEVDGADGESWDETTDPETNSKIPLRSLRRVKLHDVSVLSTAPAYPTGTSVQVDGQRLGPLELNSSPRTRAQFPEGVPESFPMEVRSRLMAAPQYSNKAREARQRLLSIVLS